MAVQDLIERRGRAQGRDDAGIGVDRPDTCLDHLLLGIGDQIGLVEQDDIGKGDLVLGFGGVLQACGEPFGIGDGDDGVQSRGFADIGIDEEGLGDRRGIRKARGFDDDGVEAPASLEQRLDNPDQIAADRAADAAVVHLEDFFIGADDEIVVDTDLAKFIDDHRVTLAVIFGQDAVEQSGLARAEIAGQDGDGDLFGHIAHLSVRRGRGAAQLVPDVGGRAAVVTHPGPERL